MHTNLLEPTAGWIRYCDCFFKGGLDAGSFVAIWICFRGTEALLYLKQSVVNRLVLYVKYQTIMERPKSQRTTSSELVWIYVVGAEPDGHPSTLTQGYVITTYLLNCLGCYQEYKIKILIMHSFSA